MSSSNFLRAMSPMPLFSGKYSSQQTKQLTSKEKKYVSNIEKALTVFDSVDEWADYISYLGKLEKALQSNPEPESNSWIPQDFAISKTLSKCLSSKLPSGVHRKTIEVYSHVFEILGSEALSGRVSIWLPGLLPLMSYASISVKPELIDMFDKYLIKLDPQVLRIIFKSILLSLLPALDDTSSESFNSVLELIEAFKKQLNNDSHFWQCLFLCVLTSPDKRLGALEWCIRKLPIFNSSEISTAGEKSVSDDNEDIDLTKKESIIASLPKDARATITPESGLLIRAFCEGLKDHNVLVQRGFFDLLLSRIPLHSEVLQVLTTSKDREMLILNAAGTVLLKDMSLNRRLWNWFLGPEQQLSDGQGTLSTHSTSASITSIEHPIKSPMDRLQYFETYGLESLTSGLFSLIDGTAKSDTPTEQRIEACKISVAIMDKWEIGQLIVPKILIPILKVTKETYDSNTEDDFNNLLKYANAFFDSIETMNIWSDIYKLAKQKDVELISFILKNYNVEDEDMMVTHIPLNLLALLLLCSDDTNGWLSLMKTLLACIPQRAFLPIELANPKYTNVQEINLNYNPMKSQIIERLDAFYDIESVTANGEASVVVPITSDGKPFAVADLSALLLSFITYTIIQNLQSGNAEAFYGFSELLHDLVEAIPTSDKLWNDTTLLDAIYKHNLSNDQSNVSVAFGTSILFKIVAKQTNKTEAVKLLKITMNQLWDCLIHNSGKYQVEAVTRIWHLEMDIESHYIEAALCGLFLESDIITKIKAFNALWSHSSQINESDSILARPLFLILDEIAALTQVDSLFVVDWIKKTVNSGSINRIFKLCCSSLLLKNKYIKTGEFAGTEEDDFELFAYQVKALQNLVRIDDGVLKALSTELCIIDNDAEIKIINDNHWSVANYTSLIITILLRFLSNDASEVLKYGASSEYSNCANTCLELLEELFSYSPSHYEEISSLLVKVCGCNGIDPNNILVSSYLRVLTKVIEKSNDVDGSLTLLQPPEFEDKNSRWAQFVGRGIQGTNSTVIINSWVKFINKVDNKLFSLKLDATTYVTNCICNKIKTLFEINKSYINDGTDQNISNVDDSICELISGLQEWLTARHDAIQASLDQAAAFGNSKNGTIGTSREAGFFGSVIQGVFQVESPSEKNELLEKKETIIRALKQAILTSYRIWLWADDNSKVKNGLNGRVSRMGSLGTITTVLPSPAIQSSHDIIDDEKPQFLKFSKSINYNASKLKFRSKRIMEGIFNLEPLETLETLIAYQKESALTGNPYSVFKVIHVLDGSKSQATLPHLLRSLISRVNITSLEAEKRSSLITDLSDKQVSSFLVDYMESLTSDMIEDIWAPVTQFLKDIYSNYTVYKFVYPDLLKFSAIVGVKLSQTSFGDQRKVRKEMTESFTRILNVAVTIKFTSQDENALASLLNPLNILPGQELESNDVASSLKLEAGSTRISNMDASTLISAREPSPSKDAPSDKYLIKEELANALVSVIPKIQTILQDSDKVFAALTSVVYNACTPFIKSRLFVNTPSYILDLFVSISLLPQASSLKVWRTLCSDIILDPRFFSLNGGDARWNQVFSAWIKDDSEKLNEFVVKMLPYYGSSSTLFAWNDSEATSKILNIKRIIYLLLICERDHFLTNVQEIQNRINDIVGNSSNSALKPYILLLFRTLILKFLEPHLVTSWPIIYTELQSTFQELFELLIEYKFEEEASNIVPTGDSQLKNLDKNLVLQGCKLLDVILILKPEEFQLCEWLFISDTTDAVYRESTFPVLALIDKIGSLKTIKIADAKSSLKVSWTSGANNCIKKPLLLGVKKVEVIELKEFFDKLSMCNYENDYNMRTYDLKSIEDDIFKDLFD